METTILRKMVHSLYGWVDHIHTSVKVGYPPQSKKKKSNYSSQLEEEAVLCRQAGAPHMQEEQAVKQTASVSGLLNAKTEETMLQPAWSV